MSIQKFTVTHPDGTVSKRNSVRDPRYAVVSEIHDLDAYTDSLRQEMAETGDTWQDGRIHGLETGKFPRITVERWSESMKAAAAASRSFARNQQRAGEVHYVVPVDGVADYADALGRPEDLPSWWYDSGEAAVAAADGPAWRKQDDVTEVEAYEPRTDPDYDPTATDEPFSGAARVHDPVRVDTMIEAWRCTPEGQRSLVLREFGIGGRAISMQHNRGGGKPWLIRVGGALRAGYDDPSDALDRYVRELVARYDTELKPGEHVHGNGVHSQGVKVTAPAAEVAGWLDDHEGRYLHVKVNGADVIVTEAHQVWTGSEVTGYKIRTVGRVEGWTSLFPYTLHNGKALYWYKVDCQEWFDVITSAEHDASLVPTELEDGRYRYVCPCGAQAHHGADVGVARWMAVMHSASITREDLYG